MVSCLFDTKKSVIYFDNYILFLYFFSTCRFQMNEILNPSLMESEKTIRNRSVNNSISDENFSEVRRIIEFSILKGN